MLKEIRCVTVLHSSKHLKHSTNWRMLICLYHLPVLVNAQSQVDPGFACCFLLYCKSHTTDRLMFLQRIVSRSAWWIGRGWCYISPVPSKLTASLSRGSDNYIITIIIIIDWLLFVLIFFIENWCCVINHNYNYHDYIIKSQCYCVITNSLLLRNHCHSKLWDNHSSFILKILYCWVK